LLNANITPISNVDIRFTLILLSNLLRQVVNYHQPM
jgi:hypothetical protein